ncbi:MAG TPA: hypothetical protein VKU44_06705 [Terriglobia bacterium]|nr:hypothetical protein [Terriglobia bacterium]
MTTTASGTGETEKLPDDFRTPPKVAGFNADSQTQEDSLIQPTPGGIA